MKTISHRKADMKGHWSDVVAYALFCFCIDMQLHRRCEKHVVAMNTLLSSVFEGNGERCRWNILVTADRGYRSEGFVEVMAKYGLSTLLDIP